MTQLNATIEFKNFNQFNALNTEKEHTLIFSVCADDKEIKLTKSASRLATSLQSVLHPLKALKHFNAEHGQSKFFTLHRFELEKAPNYQNLFVIGSGKRSDFYAQKLLHLGGMIAGTIRNQRLETVDLALDSFFNPASSLKAADAPKDFAGRPLLNPPPKLEDCCELLTLGLYLGLYTFERYKKSETKTIPKIRILSQALSAQSGKLACERAAAQAMAVSACRDMQTTPSNDLTPPLLAQYAQQLCRKSPNLKIEVFDEKKLKTEKFGGILSVGQGSIHPPRLIIMDYNPSKKTSSQPIVLVGKGVTFDTGGTSLKPAPGMEAMKMDMSGAAAVIAAVYGASLMKLKQRIVGIVPSAENRMSDRSTNPGDIYTAYNGKTVEVLNTDAEGRLILGDALSYAAKFKPAAVIDVATLTGACVIALGAPASGLMGNNAKVIEAYAKASEGIGERTWELPLYNDYAEDLKSPIADYRNIGSNREGGSSKAGCFLNFFVNDQYPWIHLDVASTADTPRGQGAHCPENVGTGVPVRGLLKFCETYMDS